MPAHSDSEPAEPPEDPNDSLEEIWEAVEEDARSFAASVRSRANSIESVVNSIEMNSVSRDALDRSQNSAPSDPGEAIADQSRDEELEGLKKQLSEVSEKLKNASVAKKQYNVSRFLLFAGFLAPTIAAAALIYTAIHAAQTDHSNSNPPPSPLPPDTTEKIKELVRLWNTEGDEKYWEDLATYVDLPTQNPPLTLADQVLFMNYTIDLAPGGEAWIWDSAADVTALVKQLVSAYNSRQRTSDMYRLVSTLRYRQAPLPRAVAAVLLRYALAQLIIVLDPKAPASLSGVGLHGEPGREGEELSEVPEDEAQQVADDAALAREENGFASHNAETAATIAQDLANLSVTVVNCDNVERAWQQAPEVPNSAIGDPTPDKRLVELTTTVSSVLDTAAKADPKTKQYNVSRYIAALFGITALGAAAATLLERLTRTAQGQPTDDLPPVPPETERQIEALVSAWKQQGDDAYWASLAAYIEKTPLTPADQILFLNYTIQLCPPPLPFIWDSQSDKAATAEKLVDAAKHSAAGLPDLYRSIATLHYRKAALPRAVAADTARLAVAWIARPTLRSVAAGGGARQGLLGDPGRYSGPEPRGGIPVRLRPRIYVAAVAAGTHPDAYARRLHLLFRPEGITDPAAMSALAAHQQPQQSPYRTAHPEAFVATFATDTQRRLRAVADQLTSTIEGIYPLPEGETVRSSTLTCLSEAAGDLPAGTVVYVRETDRATVEFALPHVALDMVTGEPFLQGLGGPAEVAAPVARSNALLGQDAASIALSVAGNLAWVMPPPWGPVVAGALTLVQLLMSQGNSTDQFTAVAKQLELFIQQRDVNNDATHIKGLVDWLQEQSAVLASTQVDNTGYILTTLLPELRKMVAPGDESVYNAIYDLESNLLTVPGAFDILVLGVTIHLLMLKMIVQLDAQLAANAKKAGDEEAFTQYTDLWLADFASFSTQINGFTQQGVTTPGWAVRISLHVNNYCDARLKQITEPYRYNHQTWVVATGGGATGTSGYWVDDWGWTYRDDGAGQTHLTNFCPDSFSGGDCCHAQTRYQYQDIVQRARDAYATAVGQQLDTTYRSTTATIKAWLASIQEWNQHLPPGPPSTAPVINGWNEKAPQGVNWVKGGAVAYAVTFANGSGCSQLGVWSPWTKITDQAFPTLDQLPTDPLGMATNRWIYRQFRKPDGTRTPLKIIAVTDAHAATCIDKDSE